MIIFYQKLRIIIYEKFKFYQKIAKSGVIKILITIPLSQKSMRKISSKLGGGP